MKGKHVNGLKRLVDRFAGNRGIAFGPSGKNGGTYFVLHDGDGSSGGWAGATLSNQDTIEFANKFVRALNNAECLPAIRDLIDEHERALLATITSLRCELLKQSLANNAGRAVSPYSPATALIVAPITALVLVKKGGAS